MTMTNSPRTKGELLSELKRVDRAIQQSFACIEDPAVSISQKMRLHLGRVELEAYAKGLRYAFGMASTLGTPVQATESLEMEELELSA